MIDKELKQIIEKFKSPAMVVAAESILNADDQSEEAFLGAQAILLLNGLI